MKLPKAPWLLAWLLASFAAASEPARVEIDIRQPDANAHRVEMPVLPQVGLTVPALPELAPGLEPGAAQITQGQAELAAGVGLSPQAQNADAGIGAQVESGQVTFDRIKAVSPGSAVLAEAPSAAALPLDAVVRANAGRKLEGVFIQQEQEGTLLAPDSRDSSGNIFRYYRPVEMRPALMAEVQSDLGAFGKVGYGLKRSLNFWDKDPYKVWNAWSLTSKLKYLGKLEAAVTAEKAWKGKVSLILERKKEAPDFLTPNPHMESPPAAYKDTPGARFLQPEIVSDKDHPAATINEAIGRTRMIIADTGHAGTQYHVFIKATPGRVQAELASLQSALQLVNNLLFAKAASESLQNVEHASLQPWHKGRSARVAQLVAQASADPHTSAAEDPDSEKHSFVGLRYWGTEDGKLVLSLELRGASIPWKQQKRAVRDMETAPRPERDYAAAQYYLTFLSLYAERLSQGRAPKLVEPPIELSAARADALISARARARGIPSDAYFGVEEFGKRLSGVSSLPPGYLFPFAASAADSPALLAFIDGFLEQSARVRALDRSGALDDSRRNIQYMFWSDYAQWAQGYEAAARRRFEALFRASAP